jgi:glycosyltransferase involved in cell wall biosynthesis
MNVYQYWKVIMKIFVVNQLANLPNEPAGTRHYNIAEYLNNHISTELIFSNFLHYARRKRDINNLDLPFSYKVLCIPSYSSSFGAALSFLIFSFKLFFYLLRNVKKGDVVYCGTFHPFQCLVSALVSKINSAHFIYEVRDIPALSLKVAHKKFSIFHGLIRYIDLYCEKRCEFVVCVTKGFTDYYKVKRSIVIDNDFFIPKSLRFVKKVRSKTIRFCYAGNISDVKNLKFFLTFLLHLVRKEFLFEFHVFGSGPALAGLIEFVEGSDLKTFVIFHGPFSNVDKDDLISSFDFGVLCNHNEPKLYQHGIGMNKIFDYLGSGLPVFIVTCAKVDLIHDRFGYVSKNYEFVKLESDFYKCIDNLDEYAKNIYDFNTSRGGLVQKKLNLLFSNIKELGHS